MNTIYPHADVDSQSLVKKKYLHGAYQDLDAKIEDIDDLNTWGKTPLKDQRDIPSTSKVNSSDKRNKTITTDKDLLNPFLNPFATSDDSDDGDNGQGSSYGNTK